MEIFGVRLSKLDKAKFLDKLKNPSEQMKVFTPNPEILLTAKNDKSFLEILNNGDYLIPDGIGIYAGFQILESKFPKLITFLMIPFYGLKLFTSRKSLYEKYGQRICGSDLTKELIVYANEKNLGVTIIDKYQAPGNKGDNLKIERQKITLGLLKQKYPNANFHYYILKKGEEENIIKNINETDDIYLFSTEGLKNQEITINNIMPKLEKIKVAIGVGGSFDMILGFKKRAPKLFVNLGLEWLWRLIINPSRMIKRIWKALPVFLWEVIKSK
ncbi:MAG: WecB/TagA/CpsF family glycosyltransferase [Candidatus Gracilibacteria bacterium]|nr:WecB/TagA/CpsF family glycosyltransferase [Candidatus Gracilibacteria bacterium]MDD2908558.1 WecB/TagA/CpsF family glycosyltransferase [Candidatus Gracilibacteria bacterium]